MSKTLRVIILAVVAATLMSIMSACSSAEKNASNNTPEGAFATAEEFDKGERYEEAIRHYTDVKNKFPYSNYAAKAELAIADVHYKQESYAEAQVSYQMFKDMHPSHPRIDYVQFRIAMSDYNQLPTSIDRDLSLANDTILAFSDLLRKYPSSEYAAEATEKRTATIHMMAEKEEYIADFYYKHEIWLSALGRYENLYKNYGSLGFDKKALARVVYCAEKLNQKEKAKKYADILEEKFPGSSEAKKAEKEIQ